MFPAAYPFTQQAATGSSGTLHKVFTLPGNDKNRKQVKSRIMAFRFRHVAKKHNWDNKLNQNRGVPAYGNVRREQREFLLDPELVISHICNTCNLPVGDIISVFAYTSRSMMFNYVFASRRPGVLNSSLIYYLRTSLSAGRRLSV